MNLFTLLDVSARRYRDATAIFLGSEPAISFTRLRDRALSIAGALGARTPAGARVAIIAANCPEYVELLFAAWAAGQVATPINAKLHPREMADIIRDCAPHIVFASREIAAGLAAALVDDAPVIVEIGDEAYLRLIDAPPAEPAEAHPDDLAWLFFTSGTTGRSKGAMLSHRNLLTMVVAHLADFDDVTPDHRQIHGAPMSHGSGLYILPSIARGAAQVVPASGHFDAREYLDLCDHHGNAGGFLAPTMVRRLCAEIEQGRAPPRNLRTIIYGGGPMYLVDLRRALNLFGPVFCQLYGQGEAPMTITGLRRSDHVAADEATLRSVGWPRSGVEVAVVDQDGARLPCGATGEIVCRGDVVMQGYWNNPAATADALRGGWLRTGDVGSSDPDGKLTLRDRSKDVIISGGSNIYPREIEDALLVHPAVAEACVVGVPDPEWGEVVVAFIVAAAGASADRPSLDAHLLDRIARFKRPKRYCFIDELPKSSYGKVLKRALVQRLDALSRD